MPKGRRGRPPNPARVREMARLRAQGLSYEQIGPRLHVSKQAVQQALALAGLNKLPPFPCLGCGRAIAHEWQRKRERRTYCLDCLPKYPATFGQRMKTLRIGAGLSQKQLADEVGISKRRVSDLELDNEDPRWSMIIRLVRVLGAGLVTIGLEGKGE